MKWQSSRRKVIWGDQRPCKADLTVRAQIELLSSRFGTPGKGESLHGGSPVVLSGSTVNRQRVPRDLSYVSWLVAQATELVPSMYCSNLYNFPLPSRTKDDWEGLIKGFLLLITAHLHSSSSYFSSPPFSFCKISLEGTWVTWLLGRHRGIQDFMLTCPKGERGMNCPERLGPAA